MKSYHSIQFRIYIYIYILDLTPVFVTIQQDSPDTGVECVDPVKEDSLKTGFKPTDCQYIIVSILTSIFTLFVRTNGT